MLEGSCRFCLLIFTFSVTEIPLCKVNAYFPARFAPIILPNRFQFNGIKSLVRNGAGKCEITLQSCISVMNKVKIYEQKISIASMYRPNLSDLNTPT